MAQENVVPLNSNPDGATPAGRRTLLANDFEPILLNGKIPISKCWQGGEIPTDRLSQWETENPNGADTGLRTGRLAVADIDLWDAKHTAAVGDAICNLLGGTLLRRVGRKGVALLFYNPDPLGKVTVSGRAPGEEKSSPLVEFLGLGQQMAAFGIHPDTGRPYNWEIASLGDTPLDMPLAELPLVTPDMIREAAHAVLKRLEGLGYTDLRISESGASRDGEESSATGAPIKAEMLVEMLSHVDPGCERLVWIAIAGAIKSARVIDLATGDDDPDFDGAELFDRWSSGDLNPAQEPGNYLGRADCDKAFESVTADRRGGAGVGTIIFHARRGGYAGPSSIPAIERLRGLAKVAEGGTDTKIEADEIPGDTPTLMVALAPSDRPLTGKEFAESDFPRAPHLWEGMILEGHPNSLDGDGGIGKTQALVQIAVAVASGKALFGHSVHQRPVLLVLCEDDKGEVKHRLTEACKYLDVGLAALPLEVWCRPGEDSTLAVIQDNGEHREGAFLQHLCDRLEAIGQPCFLGLDTISDVANMDENKRAPMNTFAKLVLGGFSRRLGTTSLVTRHPSKASMNDGTYYAGATSANAAFRNRLLLKAHEKGNGRTLSVVKSNYGLAGSVDLYHSGAVLQSFGDMEQRQRVEAERESVLEALTETRASGMTVVPSHGNGLKPKDLADHLKVKYGLDLHPKAVLDHLRSLQRANLIHWHPSTSGRHATAATFEVGPRPEGGTEGGTEAE